MGDWAFQYDTLNRLTVAAPALNAATSYQKTVGCFNYDGFGNRTIAAFSTSSDCTKTTTATASYNSVNQVTFVSQAAPIATSAPSGFTYDAAGDVVADANNSYAYDGEGRLCAVYNSLTKSQTQYVYDASGGRVAKASFTGTFPPKNTVCAAPGAATGFTLTAQYLLDQGGDQVTELNGSGAWQHSNVWAGSHLDATYDAKGLHFHLADPLGTRRIQTNIDGQVEESCQSLPFGDNLNCTTTALTTADDATEHHFTQKERDVESGNDYFGARYYSSTMGRFMSPDWSAQEEPIPYAKLDDPQTLNLYAYVQNNPLSSTDADGHCGGPGEDSCGSRYSVDDVSNIVANEDGGLQEITGSGATLHELYTDLTHAIFNGEKLNKQPENAGTSDPQKMDPTRMADIKKDVQAACTAAKKGADTVSGADKFNNQFGKSKDTRTFTGPYGTSKAPVVKNDGPYLIPYNKKKTFEAFTRQKEEKLQPKPKPKGKKSKNQGGE